MNTMRRWLAALLLACALPASAHLMPVGQGTVRLVGDSAYSAVAVPLTALYGVDDNRDGLIDAREIDAHRAEISLQLSQLIRYDDGERAGKLLFEDFVLSHGDDGLIHATTYFVAMQRFQWPHALASVHLDLRLSDQPLLMRALMGPRSDVAVLTRERHDVQFFAGPWATFSNFARLGALHILLGPDHLLFLLTALVVGAGWRYWVGMVTAFTLAHSITLTMSALGVVRLAPALVEPLIAASIVLLAVSNLVRAGQAVRHRLGLVFGCGLLHGLGLASVLGELGLSTDNRLTSLLGFNLGVELGQLAFVGLTLALLAAARRRLPQHWHARFLKACSAAAIIIGSGWIIERSAALF